ncbi:MAG: methyltransferase domain-containing protein [Alphaproteobacteria bacterium]
MSESKAPPEIFDRALLRARRARAARRGASFLMERCAADAADRLCDINRQFEHALIIGPEDFTAHFLDCVPEDKRPKHITRNYASGDETGLDGIGSDAELPYPAESPYPEERFDLIISALDLHSTNDLPGALIALKRCLKPDGLLVTALFGGNTLTELRQTLYAVDDDIFGGISARIYPFGDYSQMAALLQRAGLALPVVDTDRMTVTYKDFARLIGDIRDMGDTNCLSARQPQYLTKSYLDKAKEVYADLFSENGKYIATFEILWLTGWAPHESQQKPLKPGSAKMRLADALGTIEKKAGG